ncbi:MAG TPA: hypothetical protein VE466_09140, partial [Acidimicrobiales bacterium]|nr:hypothetical protein [Acidimicrobiales bacterium]
AKVIDHGVPDEWVAWFREAVQPGTTTLALLVEDLDQQALVGELERFAGAKLVYANLDPRWVDRIRSALGDAPAVPPRPADVHTPPQVDPGSASSDPPPQ